MTDNITKAIYLLCTESVVNQLCCCFILNCCDWIPQWTGEGIHSFFLVVYRDPNGEGLVEWPSYNLNEEYLQINLEQKKARKLKEKKVDFWKKIMFEQTNTKRMENRKVNSEL